MNKLVSLCIFAVLFRCGVSHLHSISVLVNRQKGFALDSNENGDVFAVPKNGAQSQLWYVYQYSDDKLKFDITNKETGRLLEADHTGRLFTSTMNHGNNQRWHIYDGNIWNVATRHALVLNGGTSPGTNAGQPRQFHRWNLEHDISF